MKIPYLLNKLMLLALTFTTIYTTYAQSYDLHDKTALRNFLIKESVINGVTTTNAVKLGCTAKQAELLQTKDQWQSNEKWMSAIIGVTWCKSPKQIEKIEWNTKHLTGSLDLSNCTALTGLNCFNNELDSLDLSGNISLTHINCPNNQLTFLNVDKCYKLFDLWCYNNKLSSLNTADNLKLSILMCFKNLISNLNFDRNMELSSLDCHNNELTSLALRRNYKLTKLKCFNNRLTLLDITRNEALQQLDCHNNQISSLDMSGNPELGLLICNNNKITSIDIILNEKLHTLDCTNNQLPFSALSKTLPNKNYLMYIHPYDPKHPVFNDLSHPKNYINSLQKPPVGSKPATNYKYAPQNSLTAYASYKKVDMVEYNVEGTVFNWYDGETPVTPVSFNNGVFVFNKKYIDKTLRCKMTNSSFPDFKSESCMVYEVKLTD